MYDLMFKIINIVDPSLFFPPQLGDLTLHVSPGLGDDSSQSNELQKWETLTTLDKGT